MGKKTRHSKVKVEKEDTKKKQSIDEGEADDEGEETEVPSKNEGKTDSKNKDLEEENEYEVEFIVEDRKVKGKTQYRVRWKGFSSSQDTWEDEENLDCEDLLNEFLNSKDKLPRNSLSDESHDEGSVNKNSKGKKRPIGKKNNAVSRQKKTRTEVKPDENGEFVISRIIDMHVAKNGKHEYLVLWKGFPSSESSWEPEENVKDTAAYERFLKKLEEAKSASEKQLRVSRRPTDRFTLSTQSTNRRLSRRFENKQRAKYFEAE